MPELPDVEVFRRYLERTSLDQPVERVEVRDKRILSDTTAQALGKRLSGRRFTGTHRHGKYLFVETDGEPWLVLHFGMTGFLNYVEKGDDPPSQTRVQVHFESGDRLALVDQRHLGRVAVTVDPAEFVQGQSLGPDALELDADEPRQLLGRRKGAIKAALTDQSIIAGIGNIYGDEILFQSQIHPKKSARELTDEQVATLHDCIHAVVREAVKAHVDVARMPDWFLLPHREAGAVCPRCGAEIESLKVSGRTTFFCPKCQAAPD